MICLHVFRTLIHLCSLTTIHSLHSVQTYILLVVITNNLSITSEWAINNRMVLNYSKTKTMKIYSKRKFGILDPISINLNCNNIEDVSSAKVLGIILDNHLDWDNQVDKVHKLLNSIT